MSSREEETDSSYNKDERQAHLVLMTKMDSLSDSEHNNSDDGVKR